MSELTPAQLAQSPYPGLRPFNADETEIFFGREAQTDELLNRLQSSRFLAVVGSSGCGKSSLVRAGLIAALNTGLMSSAGSHWRIAQMRPGATPIWNLASALGEESALDMERSNEATGIALANATLRRGALGLVELLQEGWLTPGANLLLLVDQFEELFRFREKGGTDEANAFVALLLATAAQNDFSVYIVLTMRTNALGECAIFNGLPQAINRGQYLTPRLSREQIRRAIIGPARVFDADVEDALVNRLLNQIGTDPDQLPLLQHALMRMWQQMRSRMDAAPGGVPTITMFDYKEVGEIAQALSNHADEAYKSLPGLGTVVERIFRALTERMAEGVENRRPLPFERLCEVTGCDKANVEQVIERFRRPDTAFLMPPPDVALSTNPWIDISHESLIRQWLMLRDWTQKEANARAELLRLVDAASQYAQNKGDPWRGRNLEQALKWQASEQPTAQWVSLYTGGDGVAQWESVQTFLTDSERALAASEQVAYSARKRGQRLLLGVRALASIVVVVSVVAAVWLYGLQNQAKSRELANQALIEIDQDPARSAHLALAAMEKDPNNKRADFALRNSLAALEIAHAEYIVNFQEPIVDARFTLDKSRLVVASGKHVSIVDAKSYAKPDKTYARDETVIKVWLIANNHLLVTLTADGQGQTQTVNGGPVQVLSCQGEANPISTLAVSGDERHIAAGCSNGELAVWTVNGTSVQRQPSFAPGSSDKPALITALGFSADNAYLASGDLDGEATIWKLGLSELWIGAGRKGSKQSPIHHSKAIRDIAFHPTDSSLLATASDDRTAIVWTLDLLGRRVVLDKRTERTKWTLKHERPVIAVRFAPRKDADGFLMTISDKRVRFWEDETSRDVRRHNDWMTDANVSDDGEVAISASGDGTADVWSTRFKAPIAVLRGHRNGVTRAFFGPEGRVVTTSQDGSLRVWRLNPPLLLASGKRWMLGAAFDPAYKHVALCGEAQSARNHCGIIDSLRATRPNQFPDQTRLDAAITDGIAWASWSADGRFLVGNAQTQDIFQQLKPVLWDGTSGKIITPKWLMALSENRETGWTWLMTVFSSGTKELLTVKSDGEIAVWDSAALTEANAQPKLQIPAKPGRWWAEMSPDGRWIAAIEGGKIALFDRSNPKSDLRMSKPHRGDIKTLKFSRDSKWLVTASTDRTARVWRVDHPPPGQFEPSVELAGGHEAALSFADFNGDGTQVVTSGADGTIRVWNAKDGHELAVLRWHGDAVNEVHFDKDGLGILSASDDGTVKLGRCEACNLTIAQLGERVRTEAILTKEEMTKIESESRLTMFDFKLPAFLSQK